MTIKPTDDIQPAAGPSSEIQSPGGASKPRPVPAAVPSDSAAPDLESRVQARRAALTARLTELSDDTQLEAAKERDQIKAKLSEVAHIIKEGVVDGWGSIGDVARRKLDHWLAS